MHLVHLTVAGGEHLASSFPPGWLWVPHNALDNESNPCQLCLVLEGRSFRLYPIIRVPSSMIV